MRKRCDQFSLRSTLQSEPKRPASFKNLLNHLVKLIHFDRIDANIRIFVFSFLDCPSESVVEFRNARSQKILKTDKQGKLNSLLLQILRNTENVDPDRVSQNRPDRKMSLLVDGEVRLTPQLHSVQVLGVFDRPDFFFG